MLLDHVNVNEHILRRVIIVDVHTDLVRNASTFVHELTGCILKPRHIIITWPIGIVSEPK